MSERNFNKMLEAQWAKGNFVCVGLDSEFAKIPESAYQQGDEVGVSIENTIIAFNRAIVEATKDSVCAYKLNIAFYEAHGVAGLAALHRTIVDIRTLAPDVPVILDAKRADIGNTNRGYVDAAFGFLQADAITVHPYLGQEALQPFLDRTDKGIIILCRTSNSGAGEFQNLEVRSQGRPSLLHPEDERWEPMYLNVARRVAGNWNKNGNCVLVVGAPALHELAQVRKIVGDMPILIPGIGAQGGDVEQTVKAGKDSRGKGMIISSSRGIIFASNGADFAQAARRETEKLHNLINQYR